MNFASLTGGDTVFLDANTLVFHFQPHAVFGPPCSALLKSIELQDLTGYTAANVIGETLHRLMMIEAHASFGWTSGKLLQRLKQNPATVQCLTTHAAAVREILQSRIHVLNTSLALLASASAVSQQFGLLTNDALIVAVMRANSLTKIASHDADFDRVPGLTRYSPV